MKHSGKCVRGKFLSLEDKIEVYNNSENFKVTEILKNDNLTSKEKQQNEKQLMDLNCKKAAKINKLKYKWVTEKLKQKVKYGNGVMNNIVYQR